MSQNHLHGGHRARLRARFHKAPELLEDHELLELLLFYAIPQKDTNALAHGLMQQYESLAGVLDAKYEQLRDFPGLGDTSALLLPAVLELTRRYHAEKSEFKPLGWYSPSAVGDLYLPRFYGKTEEEVHAIALGRDFSVKADICLGVGNSRSAPVDTRVLCDFVRRMCPCKIIIAHNHPSGIGLPSDGDYFVTDRLKLLVADAGAELIDHLIFDGNGDFVSFKDSNFMYQANRKKFLAYRASGEKIPPSPDFYTKIPLPQVAEVVTNIQTNEEES